MKVQGYTLIEVLFAMFIVSLSMLLLLSIVQIMNKMSKENYQSEDYLAIQQIRLMLVQASVYNIQEEELHFQYHGEMNYLQFHKRRYVKRPGYEIFLKDIDQVHLMKEGTCYKLSWKRQQLTKSALLVCE